VRAQRFYASALPHAEPVEARAEAERCYARVSRPRTNASPQRGPAYAGNPPPSA